MTGFATLTTKNQLTLPINIVDYMAWVPGVRLWVERVDGKIVLEKVSGLRSVQGILASHPLARKYSADEIIKLARKKKITRLYKNGF